MSPRCQNCGEHVTPEYERVFSPPDADGVRVCPFCEDKIRDADGTVREARSHRRATGNGGEAQADGGRKRWRAYNGE